MPEKKVETIKLGARKMAACSALHTWCNHIGFPTMAQKHERGARVRSGLTNTPWCASYQGKHVGVPHHHQHGAGAADGHVEAPGAEQEVQVLLGLPAAVFHPDLTPTHLATTNGQPALSRKPSHETEGV